MTAPLPAGADSAPTVLDARGITKRFGSLVANDAIDLTVRAGEIYAVMGENGAGKSTLMSILYGLQTPDAGTISIDGRQVHFRSALDAIASGLGMVHQAFKLFNSMTVWENVVFAQEPRRMVFTDRAASRRQVAELAERYGLAVDPDAVVGKLSVGVRQRVEILKALYRRSRILILDEPTAVLTPQERDGLFAVIAKLKADSKTILFVTHKLHEVMAIADRVTVLRGGRVAARMRIAETNEHEIVRAMTGRAVELSVDKAPAQTGPVVLAVDDLAVTEGSRGLVAGVSFTVAAGEIVGIAGVAGNGQTELIEALTGLRRPDRGRIILCGRDISGSEVEERRNAGLAYVPEDRAMTGSALPASARDNLAMGHHRQAPLSQGLRLRRAAMLAHAKGLIERFSVRIAGPDAPVGSLSGGNLQKIVVARELAHEAPLLIAEQPTRGVDVGAIEFIYRQLVAERDRGCAILLVSAELSEMLSLADRILVIFNGRIVADLAAATASEMQLGLLMAGRSGEAA